MAQYLVTILLDGQCGVGEKMFKKGEGFIMECLNNPEGNVYYYAEQHFRKQGLKIRGQWGSKQCSVKKMGK